MEEKDTQELINKTLDNLLMLEATRGRYISVLKHLVNDKNVTDEDTYSDIVNTLEAIRFCSKSIEDAQTAVEALHHENDFGKDKMCENCGGLIDPLKESFIVKYEKPHLRMERHFYHTTCYEGNKKKVLTCDRCNKPIEFNKGNFILTNTNKAYHSDCIH